MIAAEKPPLVSVLVTAYNAERFLGAAIESVLSQTLQDFELILINDGSTDGTHGLLERYVARDRRLRVYEQPNLGIPASANRGLELARGRYLARLDADDTSLPARLEGQSAFLNAHPEVVILGSAAFLMDESGKVFKTSRPPLEDTAIRAAALFDNPFVQSSVMLRMDALRAHRLAYDPGVALSEDYELWLRLLQFGRGANLPEPLVCRRMHPGQISERQQSETMRNAVEIARRNLQALGIDLPHEEVRVLRAWSHARPALRDQSDWKRVKTVFEVLQAFGSQPGIDLELARQVRGRWLLRLLNARTDSARDSLLKLRLLPYLRLRDIGPIVRVLLSHQRTSHRAGFVD